MITNTTNDILYFECFYMTLKKKKEKTYVDNVLKMSINLVVISIFITIDFIFFIFFLIIFIFIIIPIVFIISTLSGMNILEDPDSTFNTCPTK